MDADGWLIVRAERWGIARNHGFDQGNKRTAAAFGLLFLRINGYVWTAPNTTAFGEWIEAMIEPRISEEVPAERMRPYVQPA